MFFLGLTAFMGNMKSFINYWGILRLKIMRENLAVLYSIKIP